MSRNRSLRALSRRSVLVMAAVVFAALVLAACGGGDDEGTDVAFVYSQRGDAFQESMVCGAELKAEELGVNLEAQAPARFNPPLQVQVVDAVAAQQPDALIIVPQDPEALYPPTKAIADTGAPVVDVDEAFITKDIIVSLVLADNEGGGAEAAKIMADLIGGEGKVLPIDLLPGLPLVNLRASGFEDEISSNPDIEVLPTKYDGLEPTKAAAIVQATLAAHPDLKGIYTTTGFGAEGAVTALREAGKIGEIKIITFDTLPPAVEALERGEVQAAISQRGIEEGEAAMEQAVAALNDEPVEKEIQKGTVVITDETIDDPEVRKYTYEEQMTVCG